MRQPRSPAVLAATRGVEDAADAGDAAERGVQQRRGEADQGAADQGGAGVKSVGMARLRSRSSGIFR